MIQLQSRQCRYINHPLGEDIWHVAGEATIVTKDMRSHCKTRPEHGQQEFRIVDTRKSPELKL